MNNLHIVFNDFRFGSRILKEITSIQSNGIADTVFVAALHSEGLSVNEIVSEKIFVHRFRLKTRKLSKTLPMQLLKYLEFCFQIIWYYRNRKIGLINVHTLDPLPLGVVLKNIFRAFLIYDTHELETETNLHGIRKTLSKTIEKLLIKKADQIIVVSESIADWYQQRYQIKRPVVVLNAPKRFKIKKSDYFRKKYKLSDNAVIFIYQGAFFPGRGIPLLLETFKNRKDGSIIVFMGWGELEKMIIEIAANSSSIFFHPAVSPDVLLNYTSSADIGFASVENTCLNEEFSMPNKLFEYLMAGLPVITPPLKEMTAFNMKYKIGVCATEDTVDAVNQAIKQIRSLDLTELSQNARRTAWELAWEVQEIKLIDAYSDLLGK